MMRRALIAVIGDARTRRRSVIDLLAERVGTQLIDAGFRVLTGGLGGVMEAACRGARKSKRYAAGDTIGILPGHDPSASNPFVDVVIPTGIDHARNYIVAQADAVVAIGGGAGTLCELALAWISRRLVIGLRCEGWSGKLAGQRIDGRTRYPEIPDDQIYAADTPDDVVALVKRHLTRYQRRHSGIRRGELRPGEQ